MIPIVCVKSLTEKINREQCLQFKEKIGCVLHNAVQLSWRVGNMLWSEAPESLELPLAVSYDTS